MKQDYAKLSVPAPDPDHINEVEDTDDLTVYAFVYWLQCLAANVERQAIESPVEFDGKQTLAEWIDEFITKR